MLLQYCSALSSQKAFCLTFSHPKNHSYNYRNPKRASYKFTCVFKIGFEDIAEIIHNKVLIAAGVSAAIGQLSKPFTASLLYGKDFDLKAAVQAGGFPSTHSSSVVAAATCLALERGFSDSFFGLTVVYAGLVMYDAQGVRREVGIHAKALNKVLSNTQVNSTVSTDGENLIEREGASSTLNMESRGPLVTNQEESSVASKSRNASPVLLKYDKNEMQIKQMMMSSGVDEGSLKESIGHTEVEVVAGAILGFFVSLAVCAII